MVLGELICFGSGVIGLFRSSVGDLVLYSLLFRRGMRWWQPARMVLVAGGDWRLLWSGGGGAWRLLAMEEFCYSGGSFFFPAATTLSGGGGRWHGDCFNWVLEVVGFFPTTLLVVMSW